MDKYNIMYGLHEYIPRLVNNLELNILLLKLKIDFIKAHDFLNFKNLSADLLLVIILNEFYNFPEEYKNYLAKSILSKINQSSLYSFYMRWSCDKLENKEFTELNDLLNSFMATGLVKRAILTDNHVIKIILPDNTEIEYTNVPLEKKSLNGFVPQYNQHCHDATLYFLKNGEKADKAAVVLEPLEIFGQYYHSFIVDDNMVYDLAHNLMMDYENYLRLIKPTVLIYEDCTTILKNIEQLENNQDFAKSNYCVMLKYAMDSQMTRSRKLQKNNIK